MKRMVRLFTVGVSIAGFALVCAANSAQKDIPLCNGKPGAKIGDVRINPKDGAEMVWVPVGEFLMGSTDEDIPALKDHPEWKALWFDKEMPQRRVHLDGYWMYKYEVTVAQYRKFCSATGRNMPKAPRWGWSDTHPVVYVSWPDAADYAKWAGASLPTEAQWEKAARGTDGRTYPWGSTWDAAKCAMSERAPRRRLASTQPVGAYPAGASPYGCMDMAGNVWEWCADWYAWDYCRTAPSRNAAGPGASDGKWRVLRGGSWSNNRFDDSDPFRCANRYSFQWWDVSSNLGFRCARTP